ncbi:glycerol-3-phosphate acyltransferase [Mycoplasma sp. ATU-Cv-508]|uniref:glycerol-3-phosphate acyltransferase n=1 Tax=Mycoplasma sp. ATU-Cv-508 TaxID=2048001 RepID=UPI000FDF5AC4
MLGWDLVATLILMLIGYLIGSVNFAIIFARLFKREDIRKKGSGNAGATNIRRNYGLSAGRLTGVFDVFKILLALSIAWILKVRAPFFAGAFVPVVGIATILGHVFSGLLPL